MGKNDRNYWITVHWPHRLGDDETEHSGVYIPDGREYAVAELKEGDYVLIYESLNGRNEIERYADGTTEIYKHQSGKQGIVAIVKTTSKVKENQNSEESEYTDGTTIWWRWYAETESIRQSGFVAREDVNNVLGYAHNFSFRGFGDAHSGVKKITEEEFNELVKIFNYSFSTEKQEITAPAIPNNNNGGGFGFGEESEAHLKLKEFIAANPDKTLGEPGLKTIQVEYPFPTGDRADIYLQDKFGRPIGLEIELSQDENCFEGALQAIKYRFMLAMVIGVPFDETRSILVAYKLSPGLIELCGKYDIECHVIDRSIVIG